MYQEAPPKMEEKKEQKQSKNPFDLIMDAEAKYLKEFGEFLDQFHKLEDYIKPFVSQNEEYSEILSDLNCKLIALPISHIIINELHMASIKAVRDMTKMRVPPLKMSCPDCKKTVWDISELEDFLDPSGTIYKKDGRGL